MKKKLIFWWGIFILFMGIILVPAWAKLFLDFSSKHVFIGAFIKFFVLASAGELAAIRLSQKKWLVPAGMPLKAIVWGGIGMLIALFFPIFQGGVENLLKLGYLKGQSPILKAFYMSFFMNISFGIAMMAFHRLTDTWIEHFVKKERLSFPACTEKIDWPGFFKFVVFKTIPLFWIPMHTITFLLPGAYRVLMAAGLSFALGILLAMGKRKR